MSLPPAPNRRRRRGTAISLTAVAAAGVLYLVASHAVVGRAATPPRAALIPAPSIRLTGLVDSNSPAMWAAVEGRPLLHIVTSVDGAPSVASGSDLGRLAAAQPSQIQPWPPGGNWMEAIVADVDDTWYGYYHNEQVAAFCPGTERVTPRIGAAISRDRGTSWTDLGTILEAPRGSQACASTNRYFVGGVGDFSVMLDHASTYAYVFYSAYPRQAEWQGVSVARFLWADRDNPVGRISVWNDGVWLPQRPGRRSAASDGDRAGSERLPIESRDFFGTPIFPVVEPWHDANTIVDAFWGPSVHWNTYLQQYAMLLNRAKNSNFDTEGIYVSFAPSLDSPQLWSAPTRILQGGTWYAQVIGTEAVGTDKVAGETARFFMLGQSSAFIRFSK